MRILVTGASGLLGSYLLRELSREGGGVFVSAWSGSRAGHLFGFALRPVDLTDEDAVSVAFRDARPDLVIHSAALATVAGCLRDPQQARRVNVEASRRLARLARAHSARLVLVSTDMVFDGRQGWYREQDATAPLSVYGQTKLASENAVLEDGDADVAVARVSLLFGPALCDGRRSFFDEQVSALREQRPCTLFEDEWRTPLSLITAARGLLVLGRSDFRGVLHMGGPERLSRLEMGQRLAAFLGCGDWSSVIVPVKQASVASAEPRPRDTSLDSSRWCQLFPDLRRPACWEEALTGLMPPAAREKPHPP